MVIVRMRSRIRAEILKRVTAAGLASVVFTGMGCGDSCEKRSARPEAKHVLRHRRLRYGEAELQQFAVDSWCAPERIGAAHPPNQISQLRTNQGPTGPSATLPRPVAPETQAVPPHHRLGLHQPQRTPPARPEPRQHDPGNSVHRPQLWPRLARFPHRELLPKCKFRQRQLAVRANRAPQCPKEDPEPSDHDRRNSGSVGRMQINHAGSLFRRDTRPRQSTLTINSGDTH
jgi:hypothetical protein